jgi:hypothetical protein
MTIEEAYLHKQLSMLRESYEKAAKPIIDRLRCINVMKTPAPVFITKEQWEALKEIK